MESAFQTYSSAFVGSARQDDKKQVIKGESYRQRVRKTEKEALVTILCIHQRVPESPGSLIMD